MIKKLITVFVLGSCFAAASFAGSSVSGSVQSNTSRASYLDTIPDYDAIHFLVLPPYSIFGGKTNSKEWSFDWTHGGGAKRTPGDWHNAPHFTYYLNNGSNQPDKTKGCTFYIDSASGGASGCLAKAVSIGGIVCTAKAGTGDTCTKTILIVNGTV